MQWTFEAKEYGRSPQTCLDGRGRCHVGWISCSPEGERVVLSCFDSESAWTEPAPRTAWRRWVTGFAMTPFGVGVLLAWIEESGVGTGGLKLKYISDEWTGEEITVAPLSSKPAHPALATRESRFLLTWTEREGRGRVLKACTGRAPDALEEPVRLTDSGSSALRPKASPSRDGWVLVWQDISRERASIRVRAWGRESGLSEALAIAESRLSAPSLPSICADGDRGHFIAWQSDVDPRDGPGLVRWVEVVHLGADGKLSVPVARMRGVDRNGRGEDQGFESPAITTLKDGRLVIVGRGSQSLRRQDLGENGWTEPRQIDDPGWQCRGRHFDVCPVGEGLMVVGRERDGITARLLPAEHDGCLGRPLLKLSKTTKKEESQDAAVKTEQCILGGFRVLFGDIHQHTMASDGTGTMEETYFRARNRYRDDVVAVSDHESFLGKQTPVGEWVECCRVADEFLDPGAFVTLNAFEWTGKMHPGPGHKVVYLPPTGGPLLSRDHPRTNTSKGLSLESRLIGAVTVPHHVGWTGADMENHFPEYQPCWEIVSCHGAYERSGENPIGTRGDDKEGQFIGEALDKNLRFGFVGGSDGHGLNWHHGVSRKKDSHRTGLTAFLCQDVTREAVLEALRRRRCYATSGAKIGLWFEVDNRPMGEELIAGGPVAFRVIVAGTAPIQSLVLVTNGGEEMALQASGQSAAANGTLPPPREGGFSYYFARVVQEDGEVAWSSPVWLDAPASA